MSNTTDTSRRIFLSRLFAATGASLVPAIAEARARGKPKGKQHPSKRPQRQRGGRTARSAPVPQAPAYRANAQERAWLATDSQGNIFDSYCPNELRYPASLTKLMVVYLACKALKNGDINLDTVLTVSARAANQAPRSFKLGLKAGDKITFRDALLATFIESDCDAADVVAEALGGSVEAFAVMMTSEAQRLGMTNTHYKNASGLHDPNHVTTAHDLATLLFAQKRDFFQPFFVNLLATQSFIFRGREIFRHDKVLLPGSDVDNAKTGLTDKAGYCEAFSGDLYGQGYAVIVLGERTKDARHDRIMALKTLCQEKMEEYRCTFLDNLGFDLKRIFKCPTVPKAQLTM